MKPFFSAEDLEGLLISRDAHRYAVSTIIPAFNAKLESEGKRVWGYVGLENHILKNGEILHWTESKPDHSWFEGGYYPKQALLINVEKLEEK